jgi:hypothetical protein
MTHNGVVRSASRGWGAFLVGLVALAVFSPSLENGFAYDDEVIVAADERVHSLTHVAAIFTKGYWADSQLALYRPLTTLSMAIDWSIGSGQPAWFHFTNVLLHAAASVLAFLLLSRWFNGAAALAGGLIFAVHPVHVEAVANVVGRSEMLAALGVFGGALLWCFRPDAPRARMVRTIGVSTLFALGLGAKESGVVLLPLVALIDIAEQRLTVRRPLPWVRENAGVLGVMVAVCLVWFGVRYLVLGGIAPTRVDAVFDVASGTSERILTALQAWPTWAGLLFAPVTLLADYGPRVLTPITQPNALAVSGGFLAIALVVSGVIAAWRGHGRTAFALLWFPVTILPVSNLLVATGVIVAERTLYMPSFAIAVVVAAAVARVSVPHAHDAPARPGRTAALAMTAVVALLGARSIARIPAWRSTDAVFAALMRDRPDAFRAQWYMARQARMRGDTTEALGRYELAISLWPWRQRLVSEALRFAAQTAAPQQTNQLARLAVSLEPDDVDAIRILAGTALDMGDTATAKAAIKDGLKLKPDDDVFLRMRAALDTNW